MQEEFQQRVVTEKEELDQKLTKLTAFMEGNIFKNLPADEQARMSRQIEIMQQYSDVLEERIAAF